MFQSTNTSPHQKYNRIKGNPMNEETTSNVPRMFYWTSGIALVWNCFGVLAYIGQVTMSAETLAGLPEAQRALYENVPAWATAAYAIAVNAGALGCLLLLLRKASALPVLVLSLAGVVVQIYHAYFMTNLIEVMGGSTTVFSAVIFLIGAYLVWFANDAKSKGWFG